MMTEQYLSVKDFASAAGVSTQRIYQRLDTNLQPFVKTIKGKRLLSVDGLELFKNQDLQKNASPPCKNSADALAKNEEPTAEIEKLNNELSALKGENARYLQDLQNSEKTIAKLTSELETARKQIDDDKITIHELELEKQLTTTAFNRQIDALHSLVDNLTKQNDKLNERLDKAEAERESFESSIDKLTTALTAAQALHGMDKQQAAIEVNEQSQSELDVPSAPSEQEESAPKQSLFARLFKRK